MNQKQLDFGVDDIDKTEEILVVNRNEESKDKVELSDRVAKIYEEMEPTLLGLAHRFRAPNPQVTVNEWMSRAYEIVRKFQDGEIKAKVYTGETRELEIYDPELHSQEELIEPVKNYLKQAFVNDIFKGYNKRKKHREAQNQEPLVTSTTSEYSQTGFAESATGLFKYDAITIKDFRKIVEKDWERAAASSNCLLDTVGERFLFAVYNLCNSIINRGGEWENLVVVTDVDTEDNKKFFTYDFRSELEEGVRSEICKLILHEQNPIVIKKLGKLANPGNKQALQKRLFRYLYEYKKGFPERLRTRVKNKTL